MTNLSELINRGIENKNTIYFKMNDRNIEINCTTDKVSMIEQGSTVWLYIKNESEGKSDTYNLAFVQSFSIESERQE